MALANIIIALEDGKISESGSPAALLHSKGYIGQLQLKLPPLELDPSDHNLELFNDMSSKNQFVNTAEGATDLLTDVRRKNGDVSVYKYYLDNAGHITVGLYAISLVTWIFCTEFSSKLWH